MTTNLASTRIITADIASLVAFYEKATALPATWATPDFAELATPAGATLAIGSTRTVPLFAPDSAAPGANRSVIIEFLVDDVDALWQRLAAWIPASDVVAEPKTLPWGNRSLLVRDPDGTLVNFFTPVTPEARAKYGLSALIES
ncbi:Glyoxalase/bleomycin resistance protein/dioxygenase [Catenulispora acidiphila DSM 44928]|uniref:Glyoxalase/bleomycin resistance protein/dioxygenase n=1 Tax=Catenulispora acidiphila (strain DSM 44928 / JCM 14897 / NBRC 102108 / NRRL B-24433 / ID139908) TaxID=479433 RepID=C7PVC5_CATAD|nr:VOC family protein [Catenulispora acidiphila]ACU69281.1 Glyoxalase/bleomycin resistance protein/dioxygenase [Catenulispora acidiphila DSM 44928]